MSDKNTFVGLDVGTSKVAVCVGYIQEGLINILSLTKTPNHGLRKGIVVDIEECVSSISGALEQAEKNSGVQIDKAVIGIGGAHINASNSKGVIAVSRPDGEITSMDVERVIEAARVIALPPNQEILNVIPRQFIIDGQEGVKDPEGMTGLRLEVETLTIGGATSAIRNLSKCAFQAGVDVELIVYTPLATAKTLLTKKQRENGVILIDMGAGTTSIAVFEEDDLIYTTILPVGSLHITNDIAIGLRVPLETAEKIKIEHGNAYKDGIKGDKIDLAKIDPNETHKIEKKIVAEIIEARLKEIFSMIQDELKSIGRDGMLPAGAILTGGGSMLGGIVNYTKDELGLPAQLGVSQLDIKGVVDKISQGVYASSIGLMLEGLEGTITPSKSKSKIKIPNNLSGVASKLKDTFKNFLP